MPNNFVKPVSSELHPGVGFRVRRNFKRPSSDLVAKLGSFETPDISDQLNRLYSLCPEIRRLAGGAETLAGPAFTVKVYPGDNLLVHKCLDLAEPGDVVVVDANASTMNAVLGSMISMKAKSKSIAGFVVDGYIRDLPEILPLDFPVFARGTTPVGPLHRGPGEINYPISCGGQVINPGDIMIADGAGIVVIPRDHAAEIYQRLCEFRSKSQAYVERVRRGEFSNEWVDETLENEGCIFVD